MKKYFGRYGGRFVPEVLIPALRQLTEAFNSFTSDKSSLDELDQYLRTYAGRPTPLYYAKNLSEQLGVKVYLKREDLLHSGAHKINNTLGQALLARFMGKKRVIAETGAGQHGVATATAAAVFGLECVVYMGEIDMDRQAINVDRMRLLGADVVPVRKGARTLRSAINEALRDWVRNVQTTHYLIGSVVGPHPFPSIVAYFQSVIGRETKDEFVRLEGCLPDVVVACVGGGSNAIGIFRSFIEDENVELVGVEAGGESLVPGMNAATLVTGSPGILHGALSYLLQDEFGEVMDTHSISAGLDYPGVGPEHSYLKDSGRVRYDICFDEEAIEGFKLLSRLEGIIPALESAHAIGYVVKHRDKFLGKKVVVNLSGRGDKDLGIVRDRGVLDV